MSHAGDLQTRRHVKSQASAKSFNPARDTYSKERSRLLLGAAPARFLPLAEGFTIEAAMAGVGENLNSRIKLSLVFGMQQALNLVGRRELQERVDLNIPFAEKDEAKAEMPAG